MYKVNFTKSACNLIRLRYFRVLRSIDYSRLHIRPPTNRSRFCRLRGSCTCICTSNRHRCSGNRRIANTPHCRSYIRPRLCKFCRLRDSRPGNCNGTYRPSSRTPNCSGTCWDRCTR